MKYCSGVLINDKLEDSFIPYFLTAAHCVSTDSEARSVEAHWFYQNQNCGGESSRSLDQRYARTFGARLLALEDGSLTPDGKVSGYGPGDIALLRLLESPPSSTWFLGWQTSSDAISEGTSVIGIHHAEVKTKQISFGLIKSRLSDMLHVEWGNGLTRGGASGSPLLSEEGRILGVLSGGFDDHRGCFAQGSPTLYSTLTSFYPKIQRYLEGQSVSSVTVDSNVIVGGLLAPNIPSRFRLIPANSGSILTGERSYFVDVPAGVDGLTLNLASDNPAVDVDLYVRYGVDNSSTQYQWRATGHSGNESLSIGLGSSGPIRAGRYYISLLLHGIPSSAVGGTLTATLKMGTSGVVTDSSGIQFVIVPPGSFAMGSISSEAYLDERPVTQVAISRAFEMGRYEVTQEQWQTVMGSNPSFDSCGPACPVTNVSWNDIQTFLMRLNAQANGYVYRLPTEAEWEYAARAGTTGDRYGSLDDIAWHLENSGDKIQAVGLKAANRFGLYDMIGNVYEWVADWHGAYLGSETIDPMGPLSGTQKVARGGSKHHGINVNRATSRYKDSTESGYSDLGFRLVRVSSATPLGGVLQIGETKRFFISDTQVGKILNGEKSFVVEVPNSASSLTVALTSDQIGVDVDLYVRYEADVEPERYDWRAAGSSGEEQIEIRRDSQPSLRGGRYFVSLMLYGPRGATASGTLTATVTKGRVALAGIEFVNIPAGSFTMGSLSSEAYSDEIPVTQVTISRSFEIGRYEVTQGQWQAIMGGNPSWDSTCGANCPVTNISWNDAQEFLGILNADRDGYSYRLPTEAEWEYAARAGTTGDRYGPLDQIAWHLANSADEIHSVGLKSPNRFGLYDMLGNVWELVQDWYGQYPGGRVSNPIGPTSGLVRVVRGGSVGSEKWSVRAPNRDSDDENERYSDLGFRIVRIQRSRSSVLLGGMLEIGSPKNFRIPGNESGRMQNGTRSFLVQIPSDAKRLTIVLESDDASIDVDLFVRYLTDNTPTSYDWVSRGISGNERLTVGIDHPLKAGMYYISLQLYDETGVTASGTISAYLE